MTRGILSAMAVAVLGVIALFVVNLAASSISPERYRQVVSDAVHDGTMTRTLQQPFAPGRAIHLVNGGECQILAMLAVPRGSRVRDSISPRWPALPEEVIERPAPGYGRDPFCRLLARFMEANAAGTSLRLEHHHRYLHAPVTLAALALAVAPFDAAVNALLVSCYLALAVLALAALARMRARPLSASAESASGLDSRLVASSFRKTGAHFSGKCSGEPAERRRALAFLIFAAVLALFYALPVYGRAFSHGPTDLVLIAFLLIGFFHPLCRLPERRFVLVVAAFGTAVAALELLTGGIPAALATLIALVALGEAPSGAVQMRRLVLGIACFGAAGATSFAVKFAAIALVWGPGEVFGYFDILGNRMGGQIGAWPAFEQLAARWGFDATLIDRNLLARWLLGGAMLTYSSFILAWGSHLLGAALVLLPVPILATLTCVALRRVPREQWLLQPQPLLLAASLVPFPWYAVFTWHTATHSLFMVRPLALNVALAAIAFVMMPPRRPSYRTAGAGTMVTDAASPAS